MVRRKIEDEGLWYWLILLLHLFEFGKCLYMISRTISWWFVIIILENHNSHRMMMMMMTLVGMIQFLTSFILWAISGQIGKGRPPSFTPLHRFKERKMLKHYPHRRHIQNCHYDRLEIQNTIMIIITKYIYLVSINSPCLSYCICSIVFSLTNRASLYSQLPSTYLKLIIIIIVVIIICIARSTSQLASHSQIVST